MTEGGPSMSVLTTPPGAALGLLQTQRGVVLGAVSASLGQSHASLSIRQ